MNETLSKTFLKETLTHEEVLKFLTFPEEELILAIREHAAELFIRIIQMATFALLINMIFTGLSYFLLKDVILSLAVFSVFILVGSGTIIREVIHWYFHLYIITTKKVIEIKYNPLFSEVSNSVLLDQIRCTEIDAELYGFVSELLDLGNVVITFDRPTHQEEFVIRGIRSPRKIANYLSSHLHTLPDLKSQQIWVMPRRPRVNEYGTQLHN
ncbi:MAG: hypothetical protein KBC00_03480 [Candidatus Levybacteria bacterium]|nr:hypothetical protein [Candidatus Levybacteria bacterium]MBP9815126.1 hypothetical protein [Candidatus Levybacteria bacterium]